MNKETENLLKEFLRLQIEQFKSKEVDEDTLNFIKQIFKENTIKALHDKCIKIMDQHNFDFYSIVTNMFQLVYNIKRVNSYSDYDQEILIKLNELENMLEQTKLKTIEEQKNKIIDQLTEYFSKEKINAPSQSDIKAIMHKLGLSDYIRKDLQFYTRSVGYALKEYKITTNNKKIRNRLSTEEKRSIIDKYGKCQICGESNKDILEIHHLTELTKGGTHSADNMTCVCRGCHLKISNW